MQPKQDLSHRIFAYGTLKAGQPNHFHLFDKTHGRCRFVGSAQTDRAFPLVVATRWNVPFLLHVPDMGQRIVGEVYAVDDAMMSWMDQFEGHPDIYHRERVRVSFLSQSINQSINQSSEDHDNKLKDALESCRLSPKEKLLIDEPINEKTKHQGLNQSATNCLNEANKHLSASRSTALSGSTLSRSDSTGSRDSVCGGKVQKENKLPNRSTEGDSNPQSVDCWCYFLKDFPQGLLLEPMHSSYESKGDHHKHFVDDEDLKGIESIGEALRQYDVPSSTNPITSSATTLSKT